MNFCLKNNLTAILALAGVAFSLNCCRSEKLYQREFLCMDTIFSIKVWVPPALHKVNVAATIKKAESTVRAIEKKMSRFNFSSQISLINKMAGTKPVAVDEETFNLIETSLRLGELTGSAFNIAFVPAAQLWNFKSKNHGIPSQQDIEKARHLINIKNVLINKKNRTIFLKHKECKIGLDGIAKGYALDKVGEILEKNGIKNYIIYGGGDILIGGKKGDEKWQIGIQHPRLKGKLIARFEMEGKWAIATSGDYERYFTKNSVRYHHIIDPKTARPSRTGIISATVISSSGVISDGIATACVVLGEENVKRLHEKKPIFSALLIDEELNFLKVGKFPQIITAKH